MAMQSKVNRKIEAELLGMAEAEEMTGRSRWSWRRDCYSGAIASVKIGRRLFVPISEVRRVIAENTRPRLQGAK
jgi:methylthioribose-1-phosphate isomerase